MNKLKQLSLSLIVICITLSACSQEKRVGYTGQDILKMARIQRDKQTKQATLVIETQDAWEIYAGNSVENIDMSTPIATGKGGGSYTLNVDTDKRSYFQLITEKGSAILAEKHLPMTGGYNFRDLGGIKNKDGQYVKWGKALRSDELHLLTDADLTYLESIPLISVVDFRAEEEIAKAQDVNPRTVQENYAYCINPGSLIVVEEVTQLPEPEVAKLMERMNIAFSTEEVWVNQYRKFFALLQDETKVPLMFHCSAGKDRTGMGGALFLYALGVDDETIFEDYLLSNQYLAEKYQPIIDRHPSLKPLFKVRTEYLKAGIDEIRKNYGTVEKFLIEKLDVDIDKMKQMYLEQ